MNYGNNNKEPVRLEKQLTSHERYDLFKLNVKKWVVRNYFSLLLLTLTASLLSFILLALVFVGATESGMYYNTLLGGNL